MKKKLVALLCSDILVFVHDTGSNDAPTTLYTVLRLGRNEPSAPFGGDGMLRIVDTRAILYLQCTSDADAASWAMAINSRAPAQLPLAIFLDAHAELTSL